MRAPFSGEAKKAAPKVRRGGLHVPDYRPCAGIIQIRFNGSAADSRHLSPVPPSSPKKYLTYKSKCSDKGQERQRHF